MPTPEDIMRQVKEKQEADKTDKLRYDVNDKNDKLKNPTTDSRIPETHSDKTINQGYDKDDPRPDYEKADDRGVEPGKPGTEVAGAMKRPISNEFDPFDINKTDSNSEGSNAPATESHVSKGPHGLVNPVTDKPVTFDAQQDGNRTRPGYVTITVPANYMNEIAVILKDAGADTRSQSTSLAKIEELMNYKDDTTNLENETIKKRDGFVETDESNLTERNTEVAVTGTTKVPKHGEIPGKA